MRRLPAQETPTSGENAAHRNLVNSFALSRHEPGSIVATSPDLDEKNDSKKEW